MKTAKVAYIIVGWNNKDIIHDCIDSINKQDYKYKQIYYVDNCSSDDSVAFVRQSFPDVKIIEPGFNTGFAKGNNIGIEEALNDNDVSYIVLLNTDARIDKNWTDKIVNFALLKPKGALFQGVTLDYYDHGTVDSTHIYISRNGQGTQGSWRTKFTQELGPRRVFGVNAAACLISRDFIETQPFSELFDESMFMYLEDVDLSTRATVMGWDNYLVRGAYAYHMGSASSGKNPGFSLYMTFRNNSALLLKNLPLLILIRITPALIRGDYDTFRTLRRQGKKDASWKIVKGRIFGLFRSVLFLYKRRILIKQRAITTKELWELMSNGN